MNKPKLKQIDYEESIKKMQKNIEIHKADYLVQTSLEFKFNKKIFQTGLIQG
jgi:hypothetical protein